METVTAYISAGSNLGDKRAHLDYALRALEDAGAVLQSSSRFETEPVGYADQDWFLNMAVELATGLSPSELLCRCRSIENLRGRERSFPNAPRTLDLDILFYGSDIIRTGDLIIPHPRLAERKFVLAPMAQIAPDFIHPALHQSIRSLFENCRDASQIRLVE